MKTPMLKKSQAELIIASSESHSDMYYATRFLAPDPFVFLRIGNKRVLLMNDLEVDRARKEASVEEVLSSTEWSAQAKKEGAERGGLLDALAALLRKREVQELVVPENFGVGHAEGLGKRGFEISMRKDPFYPERMVKSPEEVKKIQQTQQFTEEACRKAIDLITKSDVKGGKLYLEGKPLTSERVKREINVSLMENECVAQHTIVACGTQGCDPHNQGTGPLFADQPIIIDIFPRSAQTRYFADMTRTVVKGKASPKIRKMFDTVREGQEIAFRSIKDGADAQGIHKAIHEYFSKQGFQTGKIDGRMQGFFHGTGHGLGLDVHEAPRISPAPDILKEGMVVTVEPGLYYLDANGGIRLEDLVVVEKNGMRNLTQMPKVLEI
jgi:Xaa-Pro aminopeptidase